VFDWSDVAGCVGLPVTAVLPVETDTRNSTPRTADQSASTQAENDQHASVQKRTPDGGRSRPNAPFRTTMYGRARWLRFSSQVA